MTGMPEAALARELGLPFASLAMVVNPAAGIGSEPVSMEAIRRESAACMARASQLLSALLAAPLPG
jgi:5'-methylthioinosine phosphorylase